MSTLYPTSADTFTTKQDLVTPIVAAHINDLQDSVVALETTVGTTRSTTSTTLDYMLRRGWIPCNGTWTAMDTNSVSVNADITSYLTRGMRILVTNNSSNKEYFIITAPTYAAGNTTFDVYPILTGDALVAGAITSPFYTLSATPVSANLGAYYPIGSLYFNATNSANPSSLLGFGYWVEFGSGRVIAGYSASDSDFNSAEKTGGAKTHTLTTAELPAHGHSVNINSGTESAAHTHYDAGHAHAHNGNTSGGSGGIRVDAGVAFADWTEVGYASLGYESVSHYHNVSGTTANAGSGSAHNNLQPYITVFCWKRTA